jgi:hypothetical protein
MIFFSVCSFWVLLTSVFTCALFRYFRRAASEFLHCVLNLYEQFNWYIHCAQISIGKPSSIKTWNRNSAYTVSVYFFFGLNYTLYSLNYWYMKYYFSEPFAVSGYVILEHLFKTEERSTLLPSERSNNHLRVPKEIAHIHECLYSCFL